MHTPLPELQDGRYTHAATLFNEMNRLRRAWAGFKPAPPLKRGDLMLLGILHAEAERGAPVTITGLARRMNQSVPGISQRISTLGEMGYVKRTADKADRRVATLALTPKGKRVTKTTMVEFLGRVEKALATLGEDKTGELIQLMHQLTDAIQTVQGQGPAAESEEETW